MTEQILQFLSSLCPHVYALQFRQTKSAGTSVDFYRVKAFQVRQTKQCTTLAFTSKDVPSPEEYGVPFKVLKSSGFSIRFDISSCADLERLEPAIYTVFARCAEESSLDTFGCCSSFTACSDARQCLHLEDPEYWGCQYRRHLEAGRIFYGKNATIPVRAKDSPSET